MKYKIRFGVKDFEFDRKKLEEFLEIIDLSKYKNWHAKVIRGERGESNTDI